MGKDAKGHGSNSRGAGGDSKGANWSNPPKGYDRWEALKSHLGSEIGRGKRGHEELQKSAAKKLGAPSHEATNALQEMARGGQIAHKTSGRDLKVSWHPAATESKVRSTTKNEKY